MKRTLSLLLVLVMVISMVPNVFATTDNSDVDFSDLFYEKLDTYSPLVADIKANNVVGFVWTATGEGTLTYEVPENYTMTLTQDEQTVSGTGTVTMDVVADEKVYIEVVNNTAEDVEGLTIEGTFGTVCEHVPNEPVQEKVVAATCTADGSYESVVYCSLCGEELSRSTEVITSTGHTAAEAVEEKRVEATCTTDGSYESVVYCSVCGEELSRTPTTITSPGHAWDEGVKYPATTEKNAYTLYTCTVCGETKVEEDEGTQLPAYAITKHPENVSGIYIGDDVTFTVEASGATAYQWMRRTATGGWKVLSGATASSYTFAAVENDQYLYACKVTFADKSYVVSNTATYTAIWRFEIYSQSPATQEVVAGNNVRLYVSAHGYGLTYKWMRRLPGKGWTVLSHDENPVYTFKAEKGDTRIHMCQVFNDEGKNIKSIEFTYTTYPFAEITDQTYDVVEYKPGDAVNFFVETTKDGQEGVTYQWYSSYSRYKSWKTLVGETNPTLTFPAKPYDAEKGTGEKLYYICIILDEYKNRTVSDVMEYSCKTALELSAVTSPDGENKVYVNGEPVTFTFTTTLDGVEGVRYQWLKRTPTGGWGVVKGATDKTMTIPAEEGNIRLFACKVFDQYGCWKLSDTVTYTAVAPIAVNVNTESATAIAGEQVRFCFEVAGVNGQSVTYRWLRRLPGGSWIVIKNETSSELVLTAEAGNQYQYLCQAFDEFGNQKNSNIVTYTAN